MHPIRNILINAGYNLTDAGEFWKTKALYRGGKNPTSLSVNKKTGMFWDFSSGERGTPETLAKLVSGIINPNFSEYVQDEKKDKVCVTKYYDKSILNRLLPDYGLFVDRGVSVDVLKRFGAGLAHSGKLNRRICFPIYDKQSRIIGFTGRWYKNSAPAKGPKWKHIGKKTEWLYPCHLNQSVIKEKREIIVVESIGDVLALWEVGIENSMCIFGVSLSAKQLNYIIGLDPNKIIIATNNDVVAGGDFEEQAAKGPQAARNAQKKLAKFFSLDKIVICLPTSKDFGDMSKDEITEWYEKT